MFSGHEKIKKTSGFVIYSCFKNSAFSAVKRDAKGCKRGTIFKWKVHKRVPYLSKMVYKRVTG